MAGGKPLKIIWFAVKVNTLDANWTRIISVVPDADDASIALTFSSTGDM